VRSVLLGSAWEGIGNFFGVASWHWMRSFGEESWDGCRYCLHELGTLYMVVMVQYERMIRRG